jgi:hypothetical protein
MKEPKVKDVVSWIITLCEGEDLDKQLAVQNLESLPMGYFEEHNIPRTKIKHYINSLPDISLTTQSQELKEWCVQLIGEMGLSSENAIKALHNALVEGSDRAIISAIWALGEIKAKGHENEKLLIEKAFHENREIRWRVAWALSQIEYELYDTVKTLIKMLKDSDEHCRGYAVIALDKFKKINNEILNEIRIVMTDLESFPRETAKRIYLKHKNTINNS